MCRPPPTEPAYGACLECRSVNAKPEFIKAPADPLDFIPDDTECGRLARAVDWAATPLGEPDTWSPVLRMMVPFVLANRFPQLLWWGPEYIQIYNDAYAPVLGAKHPRVMGIATRDCWTEIWDVLRPLIDTPFHGGPATWIEDFELELHRHGFIEECHFTVGYSPVPDESVASGIGGVLATVHEITEKVIGERRVGILRELGAKAAETRSAVEACVLATSILAQHPKDVPFAILYLFDADGRSLRQVSRTGIDGEAAGPELIDVRMIVGARWPLAEALRTEETQVLGELAGLPPDHARARRPWCPTPWPCCPSSPTFRTSRPARWWSASARGCASTSCTRAFFELVGSQIADRRGQCARL